MFTYHLLLMHAHSFSLVPWKLKVTHSLLLIVQSLCVLPQYRSSRPKVLLGKGVLKICSKFTGEYTC